MKQSRYETLEFLGKGGVGEVLLAQDHELQRKVAIKRLLSKVNMDDAAETLLHEAKILSSLNHPNIVTVHDVGLDQDGAAYVIMEYLAGETFEELVERGALRWEDFQNIAIQVLEGMIAAQEHGLVHRDIKPGNVMIVWRPSGNFNAKVLDFGLAKFSPKPSKQTVDQGDAVMGSIFFMAPEQFERAELDARTDMYSLGALFYYGLVGRYPFNGETAVEVMGAHLEHRVEPLESLRLDVPKWACQWVHWLMSRSPQDRPKDATQALEAFVRQGEGIPVTKNTAAVRLLTPQTSTTPVAGAQLNTSSAPTVGTAATGVIGMNATTRQNLSSAAVNPTQSTAVAQKQLTSTTSTATQLPSGNRILIWGISVAAVLILGGLLLFFLASSKQEESSRVNVLLEQGSSSVEEITGTEEDWDLLYPLLAEDYNHVSNGGETESWGYAVVLALSKIDWDGADAAVNKALLQEKDSTILSNLIRVAVNRKLDEGLRSLLVEKEGLQESTMLVLLSGIAQRVQDGDFELPFHVGEKVVKIMQEVSPSTQIYAAQILEYGFQNSDQLEEYAALLLSVVEEEKATDQIRKRYFTLLALTGTSQAIDYLKQQANQSDAEMKITALEELSRVPDGKTAEFLVEQAKNALQDLQPNQSEAPYQEQQFAAQVLNCACVQLAQAPSFQAKELFGVVIDFIEEEQFFVYVEGSLQLRTEEWALELVEQLLQEFPQRRATLQNVRNQIRRAQAQEKNNG